MEYLTVLNPTLKGASTECSVVHIGNGSTVHWGTLVSF